MEPIDTTKSHILVGDSFELIERIPDNSVDAIITSPPYFGLSYHRGEAILQGEWAKKCVGIDDECEWGYANRVRAYFAKARRCLKDTGVLWVKIGDELLRTYSDTIDRKAGDLVGTPWEVVHHMRSDGWHVRSEVIWNRTNATKDEKDRPIPSHETIFLFSKQKDHYWNPNVGVRTVIDAPIERELHSQYDFPFGVFPQPILTQLIRATARGRRHFGPLRWHRQRGGCGKTPRTKILGHRVEHGLRNSSHDAH